MINNLRSNWQSCLYFIINDIRITAINCGLFKSVTQGQFPLTHFVRSSAVHQTPKTPAPSCWSTPHTAIPIPLLLPPGYSRNPNSSSFRRLLIVINCRLRYPLERRGGQWKKIFNPLPRPFLPNTISSVTHITYATWNP